MGPIASVISSVVRGRFRQWSALGGGAVTRRAALAVQAVDAATATTVFTASDATFSVDAGFEDAAIVGDVSRVYAAAAITVAITVAVSRTTVHTRH